MKSIINKILAGAVAVSAMTLGSCVGDLDLTPIDPNITTSSSIAENPREVIGGMLAKCYSGLAVSGQEGPNGASDISGLDGGTSQYTRALFMLNEFTTDEALWIYRDAGVVDLVTDTWGSGNVNIFGTYSRLMVHIAVCNDFLRNTTPEALANYGATIDAGLQADIDQFRLEARALRALSYYFMIDLFGQVSWAWDDMAYGVAPEQISRVDAYNRMVAEVEAILAAFPNDTPIYGRIGKDAVEALLCRYYLNAEVFTGGQVRAYDKCWTHCENIISRHTGGGYNGTGLAKHYLGLFSANNHIFVAGAPGAIAGEDEILWNIPFDTEWTQPWGGTTFLVDAACNTTGSNTNMAGGYMFQERYGTNNGWGCMHATGEFSKKFGFTNGESTDKRVAMWSTDWAGFNITNEDFSTWTDGYACIKFNNVVGEADGSMPITLVPVTQDDGSVAYDRVFGDPAKNPVSRIDQFPDTDLPLIRLADVYLMAAECALRGAGDHTKGLKYANDVRGRAGVDRWYDNDFTLDNLLDERCRELYWELVRRTDLVRFGKFTGDAYLWSYKNNVPAGASIPEYMNLFPIPADILAAQPSFKQNPGY